MSNIGKFTLNILESRKRRGGGTRVSFDCDAIAYAGDVLLMVSAVGSESSLKALSASLHQNRPVEFAIERDGDGEEDKGTRAYRLEPYTVKGNGAYTVYRHRLLGAYGLFQMLAVADVPGFLPVLSEEALWQELRGSRFTTPLLREWMPNVMGQLLESEKLVKNSGFGATTGNLTATADDLDAIVSAGVRSGALHIAGQKATASARGLSAQVDNLDGYMLRYGRTLAHQAEKSLAPLHVPGRDPAVLPTLLRQPFPAQADVIAAGTKALNRQDALMVIGDMGSGKTLMGMAMAHTHAAGRGYRALVFCPGQLVLKWQREIEQTIPGATVTQLNHWSDLTKLDRASKPSGPEWFVISRDRAKLGSCWKGALAQRTRMRDNYPRCPKCGRIVCDKDYVPISPDEASRKKLTCEFVLEVEGYSNGKPVYAFAHGCGEQLWQMTREIDRYEPATFIKRKLPGFFDYLVLDEMHQEKAPNSGQANAAGSLIAACRKTIGLTGTLAGGYAWHLKGLLFRMAPRSLVREGQKWAGDITFNECYGRIETTVRTTTGTKDSDFDTGDENRMSRGSACRSVTKNVRPGIMPSLYSRHLLDKAVFLWLDQVSSALPELNEECVAVAMDAEQQAEYDRVERELKDRLRQMLLRNDRRFLGKFLTTLLAYPDFPFNWGEVGYMDGETFVRVSEPADLDRGTIRPKEQALIDLCLSEKAAGRQSWVFVQYTGEHDVQGRLETLLKNAGLKVGVLRSSVSMAKREEWIARHGPALDVAICHPKLVETGLDLFDKGGRHNFATLVFYETGYDLFAMRQASRRSWRIGQKLLCRVAYLYYAGTMQERAMSLMGRKLAASQALEGKFSSEGLVAMSGEDDGVEMALAKSLAEQIEGRPADLDASTAWRSAGARVIHMEEPAPALVESTRQKTKTNPAKKVMVQTTDGVALTGPELVDLMKRCRGTIKAWAAKYQVTEYSVRAWRKSGVTGDMARTIRAGATEAPVKDKKPRHEASIVQTGQWLAPLIDKDTSCHKKAPAANAGAFSFHSRVRVWSRVGVE